MSTATTKQLALALVKEVIADKKARGIAPDYALNNEVHGVLNDALSALTSSKWQDNNFAIIEYWIRKLTPRECFRLMDVPEDMIDTLTSAGISNSQLYKLAGNSIVVAVLVQIFTRMFIEHGYIHDAPQSFGRDEGHICQQLSLF